MAIKTYNDQNFVAIANAIRAKNGETTQYKPSEMAPAIMAIESGLELLPQDTAAGAIANFPDGSNNYPVVELIANIDPKQAGSGDPSPSNVRPISGSTEVNVVRSGVNIWNEQTELGTINDETGAEEPSTKILRSVGYIKVTPSFQYYFYISGSNVARIFYYDKNKTFISYENKYRGVITIPSNAYYMRFRMYQAYGTTYNNDFSINYTSSDNSYHAYSGGVKTIDLGRTVCSGTLNVTTGELTVTHKLLELNVSDMNNSETYPGWRNSGVRAIIGAEVSSDVIDGVSSIGQYWTYNTLGNNDILYLPKGRYSNMSQTDWKTTYPNVVAQFVIELVTPEVYQLTPEQVKTLLGVNNIYADTGNVKVTYRADIDLYIAKKIAEEA